MNKIYGLKSDYAPVKREGTQIIVSYGYEAIDKKEGTWYEVSLPAANYPLLSLQDVKKAILDDINARTDEKILFGYEWTVLHGDDAGKTVKVWLSAENKENYKAKYDTAKDDPELITWPSKFKVSENDDQTPVYEYFANVAELKAFYYGGLNYIEQTVNAGWTEKDAIDWTPYEALFPQQEQSNATEQ